MSINTFNEKLAAMEWCNILEPALPVSPGSLGIDDQQQLLWGYPGLAWAGGVENLWYKLRQRRRKGGG